MRFFTTALLALGAFTSCALAQSKTTSSAVSNPTDTTSENPISAPGAGDVVVAGGHETIVWAPSQGDTISLILRKGDKADLGTIGNIAGKTASIHPSSLSFPPSLAFIAANLVSITLGNERKKTKQWLLLFSLPNFPVTSSLCNIAKILKLTRATP